MVPRFLGVLVWMVAGAMSLYSQDTGENQVGSRPVEQADTANSPASQAQAANTQDELVAVPNRPTLATTAEAVQRGVFEIEYGLEAASGHQNINGLL